MTILQYYYTNIIKQDLLTKFVYENALELPLLNKIVLNLGLSQTTLRSVLPSLTALLLISSQKACLVVSKRPTLTLKVKNGVAIGCKIEIRGKVMFLFIEKLVLFILPRLKAFHFTVSGNNVFFKIDNLFLFKEIEKEYDYFQELSKLSVNINFKAKNSKEVHSILSALKFF